MQFKLIFSRFLRILKLFIPTIFVIIFKKVYNVFENSDILFNGDDSMFKDLLRNAKIYGEYGCGKSTNWVLNNSECEVISVDTSKEWIKNVLSKNKKNSKRLNIYHTDLGTLGKWGIPKSYHKQEQFSEYTNYLWNQKKKPNVVLIDGRFRVCCFLVSLKFAEEGTQIIFDDYTNRPYYHFIEKYVSRTKECGRQCLFIVPSKNDIDIKKLDRDIESFRNVFD